MIRSSLGNSFKPPSIEDLLPDESTGYVHLRDDFYCDKENNKDLTLCKEGKQYEVTSINNPNLDSEQSLDFNLGAYLQAPRFFGADIGLGADFWAVYLRNQLTNYETLRTLESQLGQENLKENYQFDLQRLQGGVGTIDKIKYTKISKTKNQAYGLDLNFNARFRLLMFNVQYGLDHSQMLSYKEGLTDDLTEVVGTLYGGERPFPKWRQSHNLFLEFKAFSFFLVSRFIGGYKGGNTKYPIYHEWDTQLAYESKWGDVAFGVTNIFGAKPPELTFHTSTLSLYEGGAFGRSYYLRYALAF